MADKPLSLRAYAKWRKSKGLPGGSLESVRKAIERRRLVDSVVTVDGVKKIADPELADREWAANTDPGRGGLVVGFVSEADGEQEPSALVQASARLKQAQADIAELKYRQQAGELMDASESEAAWSEQCAAVRNTLLSLPNRLKQRHPDLPLGVLATLDELLRADLEDLAGADEDPDDDAS